MYKIGEYVVHQTSGVCQITNISKKEDREFIILNPFFENTQMKIALPVDNCQSRIRQLMTKDQVMKLIEEIPSKENIWIENSRDRKKEFSNIIGSGDMNEISSILKTIYAKDKEFKETNKKMTLTDASILKVVEKKIYEELAIVLDLEVNEVKGFIEKYLENIKNN